MPAATSHPGSEMWSVTALPPSTIPGKLVGTGRGPAPAGPVPSDPPAEAASRSPTASDWIFSASAILFASSMIDASTQAGPSDPAPPAEAVEAVTGEVFVKKSLKLEGTGGRAPFRSDADYLENKSPGESVFMLRGCRRGHG